VALGRGQAQRFGNSHWRLLHDHKLRRT
jgi:hypothetical protein